MPQIWHHTSGGDPLPSVVAIPAPDSPNAPHGGGEGGENFTALQAAYHRGSARNPDGVGAVINSQPVPVLTFAPGEAPTLAPANVDGVAGHGPARGPGVWWEDRPRLQLNPHESYDAHGEIYNTGNGIPQGVQNPVALNPSTYRLAPQPWDANFVVGAPHNGGNPSGYPFGESRPS